LGLVGEPDLLCVSANVVFRLGDAVLRVSSCDAQAGRHVALARWLAQHAIPTVRPVVDAQAVDGLSVTVWEHIEGHGRAIDYRQVGEAIARVHQLDPDDVRRHVSLPWFGEPRWLQLADTLQQAAAAGVLSQPDIAVLRAHAEQLSGWDQLAGQEPLVVCHGDLHPHNLLMRADRAVILDWDSICMGPAAWDHAALLTWADRWDGHPDDYLAFAAGYGADLRDSALAQTLARVRLLAPTINMAIRGSSSKEDATEARLRMRYWRGEPDAPAWNPR
jgi:Ser/Thr protein kinase RdoA (MazF antagonist)